MPASGRQDRLQAVPDAPREGGHEVPGCLRAEAPEDDLHRAVHARQRVRAVPGRRKDLSAPRISGEAQEAGDVRGGVDVVHDEEHPREVLLQDRGEPVPVQPSRSEVVPKAGPVDAVKEVAKGGGEPAGVLEAVHFPVPHGPLEQGRRPRDEGRLPDPRDPEDEGERPG